MHSPLIRRSTHLSEMVKRIIVRELKSMNIQRPHDVGLGRPSIRDHYLEAQ